MPTLLFQEFQYFNTDLYRPLVVSVQLHHLDLKPSKNIKMILIQKLNHSRNVLVLFCMN